MKKLKQLDYFILAPYLVLCAIGVVMVYSASAYWVQQQYGQSGTKYLVAQLAFVIVGLVVMAFFYSLRLTIFRKPIVLFSLLFALMGLLAYLFVRGRINPDAAVNGATSWLNLGPFRFQPSEFAKITVILYLAHMLTSREDAMTQENFRLRQMWQPLAAVGLVMFLILLEPDTGGFAILLFITAVIVFASGIPLRYGLLWGLAFIVITGVGYYIIANYKFPGLESSYQYRRLVAAIHPFSKASQEGNQVVNSLYAINHGGIFGVGLGMGSQKLGYLPEPYTDFILAVIAEELGLVGAVIVVGLIFFLILRFYLIGIRSKNTYYTLISYGIATMMLIQTIFNVGAVLGLVPVTGVTLPFISYGGSSMVTLSMAIGIMLNISRHSPRNRRRNEGNI